MTQQDTTPTCSSTSCERDESFYFEGRYITFLVDTTLFRVPQHPFIRASPVFKDMFSLPQGDSIVEGSTDTAPIRLEGVKVGEFRSLLKLLAPSDIPPKDLRSVEDWVSILHLALLWDMQSVQQRARSNLNSLLGDEDLDLGVQSVLLGRRFSNRRWISRGFDALVRRKRALSEDDARRIGLESTVKVFQIREKMKEIKCYKCEDDSECEDCEEAWNNDTASPNEEVSRAFEEELKAATGYDSE